MVAGRLPFQQQPALAESGLGDDTTTSPAATTTGAPTSTSTATSPPPTTGAASSAADSTSTPATTAPEDPTGSSEETGTSECFEDPACLISHGLLARYFLDDAVSGQGPRTAKDSAPDPLHLPITYSDVLTFSQMDGNRGLHWSQIGDNARASKPISGTKLDGLSGSTTATWEVVVAIEAVTTQWSRIVHIDTDENSGSFTLSTPTAGEVHFRLGSSGGPRETIAVPTLSSRTVIHLVYDSNEPDPADRARFYLDGELAAPSDEQMIPLGEQIGDLGDEFFVLGNRELGGRTFEGTLFYAALYDRALGPDAVAHNATRLIASDDS